MLWCVYLKVVFLLAHKSIIRIRKVESFVSINFEVRRRSEHYHIIIVIKLSSISSVLVKKSSVINLQFFESFIRKWEPCVFVEWLEFDALVIWIHED